MYLFADFHRDAEPTAVYRTWGTAMRARRAGLEVLIVYSAVRGWRESGGRYTHTQGGVGDNEMMEMMGGNVIGADGLRV